MSTRSRAKSSGASSSAKASSTKSSGKGGGAAGSGKPRSAKRAKGSESEENANQVYCVCRKQDDGRPMVKCGLCPEWYHFDCVGLNEDEADEINVYVCRSCAEKTGRKTVMYHEGDEALEETSKPLTNGHSKPKSLSDKPEFLPELPDPPSEPASEDDNHSSDEEWGDDLPNPKQKRHKPVASSSSSDDDEGQSPRKRRLSHANPPPAKRRKASLKAPTPSSNADDDPVRKYCLGKFVDVFRDIFLRYPYVPSANGSMEITKTEDLAPDEREEIIERSKSFSIEVENYVYDTNAELDASGRRYAGAKYKDRFRTLTFNLSKQDRSNLHKRISSSSLAASELAVMSSTDLANEETQLEIRKQEKESLEHSILHSDTSVKRKMTKKGLEDIEDYDSSSLSRPSGSEARRLDPEEEKREQERMARLKAMKEQQRARTSSFTLPPASPSATILSPTSLESAKPWGGPPPLPPQALASAASSMSAQNRPPLNPLFLPSMSEMPLPNPEPELNLADLINIDDDTPPSADAPVPEVIPTPSLPPSVDPLAEAGASLKSPDEMDAGGSSNSPVPPPESPTGLRRGSSFDLSSLWGAPQRSSSGAGPSTSKPDQNDNNETAEHVAVEGQNNSDAEDMDLDLILSDKPLPELEDQKIIWSGKVEMPLDSTTPHTTAIVGRQAGGRSLDPSLWNLLFPSDTLRVDGRVPVDKSREYLLGMRMNSAKELISAAFSPAKDDPDGSGFNKINEFLLAKGRHGLVFPWGQRPKEHHPGRELYLVPLRANESLPDYLDLLDDLKLPKTRKADYLIGIWILNRGKLVAPTSTVGLSSEPAAMAPSPPQPPQIQPSALAAEVASLTPEQIQLMLSTLGASGIANLSLPGLQVPPAAPPPSHSPAAWNGSHPPPEPFRGGFSPPGGYGSSPPHPGFPQQSPPHPPYHDRRDNHRYEGGYSGGGQGYDRGRHRGRGRGGGREGPPRDRGWRARGGGGPSRRGW